MKRTIAAGLAAGMAFVVPAQAQDGFPAISGEIGITLQDDYVYDVDGSDDGNDLYLTVEPVVQVHLMEGLYLNAGLTFEPTRDRDFGDDRALEDHGLYVDTLQLVYEWGDNAVYGGKFTAPFGLAHDFVPGLYGDTFTETYELTERLGFGGGTALTTDVGVIGISGAVFKKDTTDLSRSAFTDRGKLFPEDGGSGNTDSIENVSLTLSLSDVPAAPGLTVQGSALRQGKGEGDAGDTWAFALGAAYEVELENGWTVAPLVEWVHATDALGVNDAAYVDGASEDLVTLGLGVGWGNWGGAVTGGFRSGEQPGGGDSDDSFVQVSAGYTFENGIGLEAGWIHLDEGDVETEAVGAAVTYALAF